MAKFMSLMLLLLVAISWSNAGLVKRAIAKRSTEEVPDQDKYKEEFVKNYLAMVVLLEAKPEEKPILQKRFEEVMELKFNFANEYAKELLEIFEEVTGRKYSLDKSTSVKRDYKSESLDKSGVDSPLVGPRATQV